MQRIGNFRHDSAVVHPFHPLSGQEFEFVNFGPHLG